jgi:thymidylate kinase
LDFKFINVVGIDGSGKTTLCQKLLTEFQQRFPDTQYIHSYHEPFLLKPLKFLARAIFMRGTDEFEDYVHYQKQKTSVSSRHRWLSWIYGLCWVLDYTLQTLYKVGTPKLRRSRLIVDRYVYDALLNTSLTVNWSPSTTHLLATLLLKILPIPDIIFLIDLSEEIALERKDDIQSFEYLRIRRERYLEIAETYNFIMLDGSKSMEQILLDAKNILLPNYER